MKTIKRIKIDASRYQKMKKTHGVDAALASFKQEVEAPEELSQTHGLDGTIINEKVLIAQFKGISTVLDRGENSVPHSSIPAFGYGNTFEKAKEKLLEILLSPEKNVMYRPENARLGIDGKKTYTYVEVLKL